MFVRKVFVGLLIKCILILSLVVCVCMDVQSYPLTLCNPMDYRQPGSPVHGIFQAGILEWVAISFSRRSS